MFGTFKKDEKSTVLNLLNFKGSSLSIFTIKFSSTLPNFTTLLDNKSIEKFFNYNFGSNPKPKHLNTLGLNRLDYSSVNTLGTGDENLIVNIDKLLPLKFNKLSTVDFSSFLKVPNITSILSAENDSKQYSNNFKFLLNLKHKKKTVHNLNFTLNSVVQNDPFSQNIDPTTNFHSSTYNTENTLKFKDYKSSNAQFLGSERTVRLLTNLNSNMYKWNISASPNTPTTLMSNLLNYGTSQNYIYSSSSTN
jgi:hypothetical protein